VLYVRGDTLFTSDWHVLHRNIYWFLPRQRQRISGASNVERLSPEDFLAAERQTYERIRDHVREALGARPIRRFVFLGDFVFGLGRGHRSRDLLDTVEREVPAVVELFELLRARNVTRLLVMGNHDDFKLRDKHARAFYQRLFDDVSFFIRDGNLVCTHFPLGYSRVADATRGSADEKYYRMNKAFHRLDRRLLDELAGVDTLNFHGHVHAGEFGHTVDGVTHHNVALDVVAGG
jgi:calcineurin-like phosphoesterase family protein